MTRINLGVQPAGLCDQHLLAEYRELPRVFAFPARVLDGPFRLGRGHVLWCAQYPGSLAERFRGLVTEMRHRGFHVRFPEPRGDGERATRAQIIEARGIVLPRIQARLADMRRTPTWTRREPPTWASDALKARQPR